MARRISLREFQENLARRLAESRDGDRRTLLGVEAGGRHWLVELADTGEVLPVPPLTGVPLTESWFRGLTNVRGTLYGVVDWSRFHGGDAINPGGQARIVLLHPRHGAGCALLVARASGLRSPDEFEPDTSNGDTRPAWVDAVMRDVRDQRWLHLDVPNLIRQTEFLDAGRGQVAT